MNQFYCHPNATDIEDCTYDEDAWECNHYEDLTIKCKYKNNLYLLLSSMQSHSVQVCNFCAYFSERNFIIFIFILTCDIQLFIYLFPGSPPGKLVTTQDSQEIFVLYNI